MDNKYWNLSINELCKMAKCNKLIAWGLIAVALTLSFATIKNSLDNSSKPCNLCILVVPDSLSNVKYLTFDTCKISHANQEKDAPISSNSSDTTSSKSPEKASRNLIYISKSVHVTDASVILLYCFILVFIALSLWGAFMMLFKVLKFEHDMKSKILDVQKEIYKEEQMWELARKRKQQEFKDKEQELDLNKKAWNELEKERAIFKYEHERAPESIKESKEQKKNP